MSQRGSTVIHSLKTIAKVSYNQGITEEMSEKFSWRR